MSDYLWDKAGEVDPEVERLEKLLGTLAHRPRPLELPAAATRPRRFVAARLAAAAALLLAALAGALVALKGEGPESRETPVAAAPERAPAPPAAGRVQESAPPTPARDETEAAGRKRPRPRAPRAVAVRGREPDARELEAKEQLVYALRLTGTKLEEVRRRVRGADETEAAPAVRGGSR